MHEERCEVFEVSGVRVLLATVHSASDRVSWTTDTTRGNLIVNLACDMQHFEAATQSRLYLGAPTVGEFSWLPPGADFKGWYGAGSIAFLEISPPPQWPAPRWPRLAAFDLQILKVARLIAEQIRRRWFLGIDDAVRDLWAHLMRSEPRSIIRRGAPLSETRFEDVQRSVEADLATLRTANDLAGHTGAGLDGLNRTFQSWFGMSAARYLDTARLRRARRLICRTERPIGAIAVEAGFASQSHLTDRMRHRSGVTPAQLRRMVAGHTPRNADRSGGRHLG